MNVLTIDQIIKMSEELANQNPMDFLLESDKVISKALDILREMKSSFQNDTEIAKEIVLRSLNEEKFVDFSAAVEALVLTSMMSDGMGKGLFKSHISGELKGYTHTVVLTIIGALFREGVL